MRLADEIRNFLQNEQTKPNLSSKEKLDAFTQLSQKALKFNIDEHSKCSSSDIVTEVFNVAKSSDADMHILNVAWKLLAKLCSKFTPKRLLEDKFPAVDVLNQTASMFIVSTERLFGLTNNEKVFKSKLLYARFYASHLMSLLRLFCAQAAESESFAIYMLQIVGNNIKLCKSYPSNEDMKQFFTNLDRLYMYLPTNEELPVAKRVLHVQLLLKATAAPMNPSLFDAISFVFVKCFHLLPVSETLESLRYSLHHLLNAQNQGSFFTYAVGSCASSFVRMLCEGQGMIEENLWKIVLMDGFTSCSVVSYALFKYYSTLSVDCLQKAISGITKLLRAYSRNKTVVSRISNILRSIFSSALNKCVPVVLDQLKELDIVMLAVLPLEPFANEMQVKSLLLAHTNSLLTLLKNLRSASLEGYSAHTALIISALTNLSKAGVTGGMKRFEDEMSLSIDSCIQSSNLTFAFSFLDLISFNLHWIKLPLVLQAAANIEALMKVKQIVNVFSICQFIIRINTLDTKRLSSSEKERLSEKMKNCFDALFDRMKNRQLRPIGWVTQYLICYTAYSFSILADLDIHHIFSKWVVDIWIRYAERQLLGQPKPWSEVKIAASNVRRGTRFLCAVMISQSDLALLRKGAMSSISHKTCVGNGGGGSVSNEAILQLDTLEAFLNTRFKSIDHDVQMNIKERLQVLVRKASFTNR